VLIAAQRLPSFLLILALERKVIFAAMTAGERTVLPEGTFRIKPIAPPSWRGFGFYDIKRISIKQTLFQGGATIDV
jgi:hypothetical protein